MTVESAQRKTSPAHHRRAIHFRTDVESQPDDLNSRCQLATALQMRGDLRGAEDQLREILRRSPQFAAAYNNLGNILKLRGRWGEAVAAYREAIRAQPVFAEAHFSLGLLLVERSDLAAAAVAFERAIEQASSWALPVENLGRVYVALCRLDDARVCFERAARLIPDSPEIQFQLGSVLADLDECETAIGHLQRAVELRPRDAAAATKLAEVLETIGRIDESVGWLKRTLEVDPDHVVAYLALARSGKHEFQACELNRLNDLADSKQLSHFERSDSHLALGTVLDRRGEFEGAFDHFQQANELRKLDWAKRGHHCDPAEHTQTVDRIIQLFTKEFIAERVIEQSPELPVFIIGMPRSGTTLAEQILASHPQVHGAGELGVLQRHTNEAVHRSNIKPGFPGCIAAFAPQDWLDVASGYLRHVESLSGSSEIIRVVDKNPFNFFFLGVIAILFPRARVIHCRRNPLDVAISCYMQRFTHPNLVFTNDMQHIGHWYLQYEKLMQHWHDCGLEMFHLDYEQLVQQPERLCRELVEFCGLCWDERCLNFHSNHRSVRTASAVQVRQPVYVTSVGRWKNYAAQLAPLMRLLETGC